MATDAEDDPLAAERSRVVIWVEGRVPPGEDSAKPEVAKMTQESRRFIPETVVIPAGGKVTFPNLDPIFHNVFSLSRPKRSIWAIIPRAIRGRSRFRSQVSFMLTATCTRI